MSQARNICELCNLPRCACAYLHGMKHSVKGCSDRLSEAIFTFLHDKLESVPLEKLQAWAKRNHEKDYNGAVNGNEKNGFEKFLKHHDSLFTIVPRQFSNGKSVIVKSNVHYKEADKTAEEIKKQMQASLRSRTENFLRLNGPTATIDQIVEFLTPFHRGDVVRCLRGHGDFSLVFCSSEVGFVTLGGGALIKYCMELYFFNNNLVVESVTNVLAGTRALWATITGTDDVAAVSVHNCIECAGICDNFAFDGNGTIAIRGDARVRVAAKLFLLNQSKMFDSDLLFQIQTLFFDLQMEDLYRALNGSRRFCMLESHVVGLLESGNNSNILL
eukprot:TRINITY_DN3331_c0_g1_i1.p1 TRINITY_DN3331_c0_g1~~TRINITY_DN3331_c0_g1_i1.p1  ORF type:complete len:345 (+),score=43.91 TRINITY_DN3331_c0_g1_i1:48-1037(+)